MQPCTHTACRRVSDLVSAQRPIAARPPGRACARQLQQHSHGSDPRMPISSRPAAHSRTVGISRMWGSAAL